MDFSRQFKRFDPFFQAYRSFSEFADKRPSIAKNKGIERTFRIFAFWGRHSVLEGWCAGHNPPFVQRRHSAKRATRTSRRHLTGAYLPFHLAGQPFHRNPPNILNTFKACIIVVTLSGTYRFCAVAKALALRPMRALRRLRGGRSFLTLRERDSHPPAHQPKQSMAESSEIRIMIATTYDQMD